MYYVQKVYYMGVLLDISLVYAVIMVYHWSMYKEFYMTCF